MRLLRRFAPRNDISIARHCEERSDEAISVKTANLSSKFYSFTDAREVYETFCAQSTWKMRLSLIFTFTNREKYDRLNNAIGQISYVPP